MFTFIVAQLSVDVRGHGEVLGVSVRCRGTCRWSSWYSSVHKVVLVGLGVSFGTHSSICLVLSVVYLVKFHGGGLASLDSVALATTTKGSRAATRRRWWIWATGAAALGTGRTQAGPGGVSSRVGRRERLGQEFVSTGRRLAEAMDAAAGRRRMLNGEGEGDPAELELPARRTNGEEEIRAHARGS